MNEYMLSTTDNPYNPFIQFNEWLAYDTLMGYDSCGFLARVALTSEELSDTDQALAIDDAIDEILYYNINGLYCKVARS